MSTRASLGEEIEGAATRRTATTAAAAEPEASRLRLAECGGLAEPLGGRGSHARRTLGIRMALPTTH